MITKISSNKLLWLVAIVVYLWKYLLFIALLSLSVYGLYEFGGYKVVALKSAIPIGVLGTALSIFLSFRNNAAYDRWWEARKIWGGIVNYSRTFAMQVFTYISDDHLSEDEKKDIGSIQKELVYRHLAYINALRLALREQHDEYEKELMPFLSKAEITTLLSKANKPTQLNFTQASRLKVILKDNLIEDFRLYEMMHSLEEFYNLQGKAERIKKTPFPMYYDFFIKVFLFIFVFFLPISLIGIFDEISQANSININWLVIPVSTIVAFMFIVIEQTGFFTETPFENANEDVPLSGLCRTIEIDLRQMLNESDIPSPFPKRKILIDGEFLM